MMELLKPTDAGRQPRRKVVSQDVLFAVAITVLAIVLSWFARTGGEPVGVRDTASRPPAVGISADADHR
jgi:hypothetical protein